MLNRSECIVLKTLAFRETSKIATFYTKDFGKLKVLFKGIRKDPKKFATNLEPFSLNELIFYFHKNRDLHLAGHCDLKESFNLTRYDLKRFSVASYLLELTDSLTVVEDPHPEVFDLLLESLEKLNQNLDPLKVL
ncbi:MAG: DNA repair protein RecO, partial [Candidatus Omnitrophota bacterium]